jgi:hypothetical protein
VVEKARFGFARIMEYLQKLKDGSSVFEICPQLQPTEEHKKYYA